MNNRSVPANVILPHIFYSNVLEALNWLTHTFGFREQFRFSLPDGQLHGAMVRLGDAWIMLKSPGPKTISPAKAGYGTQSIMLFVEDVDAHYIKVKSSGAPIIEELMDTEYGERHYVAQDPEGHQWMFSKHVHDVCPSEWGAVLNREDK